MFLRSVFLDQGNSVKDLCEFIWEIEKKYQLNSQKINGIYFWPIVRMNVYYLLSQKLSLFEEPHPSLNSNSKKINDFLKILFRYLKKRIILKTYKQYNFIIFPHSRKVGGIDIYSDLFVRTWGEKALIIDKGNEVYPRSISMELEHKLLIKKAYRKIKKVKLSQEDTNLLNEIENEVLKYFGITFDLKILVKKNVLKFESLYNFYLKQFELYNPQAIVLTVAYASPYIIAAAKKLKIKVIEPQHGVITPFHLGYSFPYEVKNPYAPDVLLTFGRFWNNSVSFSDNLKFEVIGSENIWKINSSVGSDNKEKRILFTSQGVIGEKLFSFAANVAKELEDYLIYFNPHPSEIRENYEREIKELDLNNFNLTPTDINYFEFLSISEFHAGVFSTTLFEGMALGCKTIIIDLPGVEYMDKVIEANDAVFIRNVDEFVSKFQEAKVLVEKEKYYKKPELDIIKKITE